MRTGQFLEGVSRTFDVDLAVVLLSAESVTPNDFVLSKVRRCHVFSELVADTHYQFIDRVIDAEAKLAAFQAYGKPSICSLVTPALCEEIEKWIAGETYAVVHIMRLYLAPVAQIWLNRSSPAGPVLTLDCDENETTTHQSLAQCHRRMGNVPQAHWLEAEARAFEKLGQDWLGKFARVFFSCSDDASAHANARYVPNSSHIPANVSRLNSGAVRNVLFLGTLSYAPNTEAALWFAESVWPFVLQGAREPLKLWLVGPEPAETIQAFSGRDDIEVTGAVPDVARYYRTADLVVVPIRSGGGTRIKVVEAAAYGVPMVATTLGAGGLDLRHERDLLIADDAQAFAEACLHLLNDRALAESLVSRANRQVRRLYDRDSLAREIGDAVLSLARGEDAPSNIT